jgi:putative phosphoesterase
VCDGEQRPADSTRATTTGKGQGIKRVGVISDTHGDLPRAVHALFEGVELIVHAGDIGGPSILFELEAIAPVCAVLGNCDRDEYGPKVRSFARPVVDGTRMLVAHRPKDALRALANNEVLRPGEPLPAVVIHGHTHIPRCERRGAVWLVCPGSASYPRDDQGPTVGILTVHNGTYINFEILSL